MSKFMIEVLNGVHVAAQFYAKEESHKFEDDMNNDQNLAD